MTWIRKNDSRQTLTPPIAGMEVTLLCQSTSREDTCDVSGQRLLESA